MSAQLSVVEESFEDHRDVLDKYYSMDTMYESIWPTRMLQIHKPAWDRVIDSLHGMAAVLLHLCNEYSKQENKKEFEYAFSILDDVMLLQGVAIERRKALLEMEN